MNNRMLVAVAVRVFSIVMLYEALKQTSPLLEYFSTGRVGGLEVSVYFLVAMIVFPLLAALLLWAFPVRISQTIVKEELDVNIEPISVRGFVMGVFIAVGLYMLSYSISDVIYHATVFHMSNNSIDYPMITVDPSSYILFYATIFDICLALILIFKSKTLASLLLKIVR